MLRFRLVSNTISRDIQNILRLGTSTGRRMVQRSMAVKFLATARRSFTEAAERPKRWPPLSSSYAKRVHRKQATLKVTGALLGSLRLGQDRDNFSEVLTDMPYSWAHMFGYQPRNLPARPYFPVEFIGKSYRLTESCDRQLWMEAKRVIQRVTRGTINYAMGAPYVRSRPETHNLSSPVV